MGSPNSQGLHGIHYLPSRPAVLPSQPVTPWFTPLSTYRLINPASPSGPHSMVIPALTPHLPVSPSQIPVRHTHSALISISPFSSFSSSKPCSLQVQPLYRVSPLPGTLSSLHCLSDQFVGIGFHISTSGEAFLTTPVLLLCAPLAPSPHPSFSHSSAVVLSKG